MNITINEFIISQCNGKELAVYTTLRRFMNYKRKDAEPSIPTLAGLLDWCENSVRKWLRKLEQKGIILIKHRPKYKNGKRYDDTNLYHFLLEGVVQKMNKTTSKSEVELNKIDKIVSETKNHLVSNFGNEAFEKALKTMKKAMDTGTIINDILAYLTTLCISIKAQMTLVQDISTDRTIQKREKPSVGSTRPLNRFHNFEQRTFEYSPQELENILRSKF